MRLMGPWGHPQWRVVVELQLGKLESTQKDYVAALQRWQSGDPHAFADVQGCTNTMSIDAHFLMVAIRHILRCQEHLCSRTGSDQVLRARRAFDQRVPHAKDLRDFLEHGIEYGLGLGRQQRTGRIGDDAHPLLEMGDTLDDEIVLWFDELSVPLKAAAREAISLAEVLTVVWNDHFFAIAQRETGSLTSMA